jgi:chromosome segregation ATPase
MGKEVTNQAIRAVFRGAAIGWMLVSGTVALAESPKGDPAVIQTLRKAQGMLRQLSQEKADLEAKNAELQERVKSLESTAQRLGSLENEVRRQKAGLEALQSQNQSLQTRIGGDAERISALGERHRKTAGELEKVKRDNLLLVNAVKERTQWIEDCSGKNKSLIQANREILEKFSQKGFWESLAAAEPLTGIGAVADENAVQEFRYKLENLEITPFEAPPVNAQSGQAAGETASTSSAVEEEDE